MKRKVATLKRAEALARAGAGMSDVRMALGLDDVLTKDATLREAFTATHRRGLGRFRLEIGSLVTAAAVDRGQSSPLLDAVGVWLQDDTAAEGDHAQLVARTAEMLTRHAALHRMQEGDRAET